MAKHTPAEIFVFSPHGGELLATPLPEEGALISFNVSRKDVREELVAAISLDGEILLEYLIQQVLAALLAHSSPSSLLLPFSLSPFLPFAFSLSTHFTLKECISLLLIPPRRSNLITSLIG